MPGGPQPLSHTERWALAESIAARLQQHFGGRLLALGVYGSLARNADGPYSDIEMHCVVAGVADGYSFEWSTGPWKAEVDVYSPEELLAQAAVVDGDWPITHGALVNVRPLFDPGGLFPRLRQAVLSQPESAFRHRMAEVIVGDIYELIGKLRNLAAAQDYAGLTLFIDHLAILGACLQGLRHRHLFTTFGVIFAEALALPDPPAGLAELCQLVSSGNLSHPPTLLAAAERFWEGVEAWAAQQGLRIETSLDDLLDNDQKI